MLCHYDNNLQLFLSELHQIIKIDFVKNYTIITKITRNLNCFMLYIELTNNKITNFLTLRRGEGTATTSVTTFHLRMNPPYVYNRFCGLAVII